MRGLTVAAAIAVVLFAGAGTTWAQDSVHKLGRGLTNVFTGWIEVPTQVYRGAQQANPVVGTGAGLFKGIANTILRAVVGLYDVVTFPIPYPRAYTSAYEQLGLPDFAWE